MSDPVSVGARTSTSLHNNIFRREAVVISSDFVWDKGNAFYADPLLGDIDFTLPLAADWPNEEIYVKRTTNGFNIVKLLTSGSDSFEGKAGFDYFTLAFASEYVKIKSDGVSAWFIIERRTNAGAAISLSAQQNFNVTATPQKLTTFDTVNISTRTRCEANLADSSLDVVQLQSLLDGDVFDLRFSVSIEYANNQNLRAQLYLDGEPMPSHRASGQGQGNADDISFSVALPEMVTCVCKVELYLWGDIVSTAIIKSAMITAERISG